MTRCLIFVTFLFNQAAYGESLGAAITKRSTYGCPVYIEHPLNKGSFAYLGGSSWDLTGVFQCTYLKSYTPSDGRLVIRDRETTKNCRYNESLRTLTCEGK